MTHVVEEKSVGSEGETSAALKSSFFGSGAGVSVTTGVASSSSSLSATTTVRTQGGDKMADTAFAGWVDSIPAKPAPFVATLGDLADLVASKSKKDNLNYFIAEYLKKEATKKEADLAAERKVKADSVVKVQSDIVLVFISG